MENSSTQEWTDGTLHRVNQKNNYLLANAIYHRTINTKIFVCLYKGHFPLFYSEFYFLALSKASEK